MFSSQPGRNQAMTDRKKYAKTVRKATLMRVSQPQPERPKRIEPPMRMKTQRLGERMPAIAAIKFRIQVSIKYAPF